MKYLLLILFILPFKLFSQEEIKTYKLNKNLTLFCSYEICGVKKGKEIIYPMELHSVDATDWGGFLIFKDSLMGYMDDMGNISVPLKFKYVEPLNENLLQVTNFNDEIALFHRKGNTIVDFARQEFGIFEDAISVYRFDESAFYDSEGKNIIPFKKQQILVLDDYGRVVGIKEPSGYNYIRIPEDFKLPTGFIKVSDQLLASQTEVTLKDYFAFIVNQKDEPFVFQMTGYDQYKELLPDTNRVESKFLSLYRRFYDALKIDEPLKTYELSIKNGKQSFTVDLPFVPTKEEMQLLDFPVTGVSFEQAKLYTKWLQGLYSDILYADLDGHYNRLRLPTEQEYIQMAESGLKESMKKSHVLDSVNAENCMLFIFRNVPACKGYDKYITASRGGGSVKAYSLNPDLNGMYQLFGNVSEMTSVEGLAKGGSFFHSAKEAKTTETQSYSGPQPWLGFRVVWEFYFEE